ncbi:MAG: hypothetical protein Sapg2KO_27720 [Saprospiraceae bacterium]
MYNWISNYTFLWVCLLVIPTLAFGQQVAEASMTIDLTETEVQINIEYQLAAGEPIDQLKLKGIGKDWRQMSTVQVQFQDKTYELLLEEEAQLVQDLMVQFDTPLAINGSESLKVSYQMRKPKAENQSATYTIPVLYIDAAAAAASKDVFQVTLITQTEQTIQSIFPAMAWKKNANNQYAFSMQVLPAWIKFNLYPGEASFLTLERKVDFGVLFVLMGLLIFGAQRLKQHKT